MNGRPEGQYLTNQAFGIVSRAMDENNRGRFEEARSLLENALGLLDEAVAADPTYPHAHNERAFVLGRLSRPDEAMQSARAAIALAPRVPKFHMALIGIGLDNIARQKTREERRRSARAYQPDIEELIRAVPRYPSGFLAMARLQALTGAGQSEWESTLSRAAAAYFSMKYMSSGEPATEAAVAQALKTNIQSCLELAREWDRLPERASTQNGPV